MFCSDLDLPLVRETGVECKMPTGPLARPGVPMAGIIGMANPGIIGVMPCMGPTADSGMGASTDMAGIMEMFGMAPIPRERSFESLETSLITPCL